MVRRFFSYYRPYKGLFLLDFSCTVIMSALELVFPLAVAQVVDKLLPSGNWHWVLLACIGLLSVYVINTGLNIVINYWGNMLGLNIETDMRNELFSHMQKLSFRFFDTHRTGQLMSRISNDLMDVGSMAHNGPEHVFIIIITLIGALGVMFTISWKLSLITLLLLLLLMVVIFVFAKKMTRAFRQMFASVGCFYARLQDALGGIRVVQAFTNEEHQKKLFISDNQWFHKVKMEGFKIFTTSTAISYLLMRFLSLFALAGGSWFYLQGELTSGQMFSFILLINVIIRPIQMISTLVERIPKGVAGFKNFVEIMDIHPDIVDAPDAVDAPHLQGNIRYNNVSFAYEEECPVLENVDLFIPSGETVAFVGPSGGGKTTLCSLLPRFYEVLSGSITIDGIDINKIKLQSLRQQIGIVQQDVFLFAGTIRENILYGKMDATEDEIWEAVVRSQMDEFIRAQTDGLDAVIGERGVKLSGGQKQRLSIARMFLKNPAILILDEATSALDTETETAIQKALAELSKGRTTLVIAHRLATIKNADRIIVVTAEGIAEQGSHQKLLAEKGIYSRLHHAQFST
ncbi:MULTISPECIES: ABC transporter ATP-binding protein [Pelosinus]|uniref:ABC transporter transmembrane region n=1 Tax=Pelosinus fermentans B4 TaxID=1149862 RepID=I9L7I4_9FIRM|nr:MULTISPECIES: ABC transporter ATP-binding protein [Pelosinus]EIW16226.1 ABC transporter transmembrane region [Pelosinus fermentans B4]EIW22793.1 ABC transporter related protein [Pelosinus fermentans A11]OAM95533.1 Xenobiotic-transporting ATPase [Pelosinus fermentans DSM 17108]SDR29403.1 ATP-binding cassette, subfamily B [Pelosinus fermentans]